MVGRSVVVAVEAVAAVAAGDALVGGVAGVTPGDGVLPAAVALAVVAVVVPGRQGGVQLAGAAVDPALDDGVTCGVPLFRTKLTQIQITADPILWPYRWYGYKLHLVADAKYELPIAAIVATASGHDVTHFRSVLQKAQALHPWLRPAYVTADAGYDAGHAYEYVVREMKAVAVIKNRKMRRGHADDIADEDGTPRCLGGKAMTFLGYTDDGKLRYRCLTGGCQLKGRQGVLYCDTTVEIDPQENLRRFSLIPRRSKEWRALYSRRQSVERCFSRLKQHRALDSHCRRGLRKVRLHALMGLVTMQAAAVVRAERGEVGRVREVSRRVA